MKNIKLSFLEYVNFSALSKKMKFQHEFNVIHGEIFVTSNINQLKELGY